MKRREFVQSLVAGTSALVYEPGFAGASQAPAEPQPGVKRVLVMFKCHLDVGFIDTQAGLVHKYFDQFFPKAIEVAAAQRQAGADRYIWTTGSWLLYEYLEQASSDVRRRTEQAIAAGDLAWHALPFTWQTEIMDLSLIEGAGGFSKSLDQRFGRTTTGAKMTDVPGHSRGIIAPLAAQGVKLLDIGVNPASTSPDVPPLFVWKGSIGASLLMMYHHEYGGVVEVPGSDLALAIEMRGDNAGPHTPDEISKIYARLRQRFPSAQVTAATLTDMAEALEPYRGQLPVVTQEIGDTWIYGVPSDPIKMARYREISRLRQEWLRQGKFRAGDETDRAFLARFALCAEHTWGTTVWMLKDFDRYTPQALNALDLPTFEVAESSWAEKRKNIDVAVANLPQPLASEGRARLRALQFIEPATAGLAPLEADAEIESAHWVVALDPHTGALQKLRAKSAGRDWASPAHPLALFSYQTLSQDDYQRYQASYITIKSPWAPTALGKRNIEKFGAQSRVWTASLAECWSGKVEGGHRLVARLQIDDPAAEKSGLVAWPQKLFLEVFLPDAEPEVQINFACLDKVANRFPEALWLSFVPPAPDPQGWRLEKVEQWVSPFDVVAGGNRQMHAISRYLRYQDADGTLTLDTLDAPVVSLGEMSPLAFSNAQPDLSRGLHFSLYSNAWGTNYIQWFGEDTRFRFVLRAFRSAKVD